MRRASVSVSSMLLGLKDPEGILPTVLVFCVVMTFVECKTVGRGQVW